MKKILKRIGYGLLAVLVVVLCGLGWFYFSRTRTERAALARATPPPPLLQSDNFSFRDLNKNGRLDPYEDARQPVAARVEDLLAQMTLAEKAGLMMHTFISFNINEQGDLPSALDPMSFVTPAVALFEKHMNFFNVFMLANPTACARFTNTMQHLAERTRLGIPITFSTDPRHGAMQLGSVTSMYMPGVSHWCEPFGFAAIDDSLLVAQFGRMVAREYRAMGLHTALHPMADLATEPRWARIFGTFGEDANTAARLIAAYVRGFQGDSLSPNSVACVTKHFPGGGPLDDGWDSHFRYGQNQVYPGHNFDYHLIPFRAAMQAGTAQMMPYYSVARGLNGVEEVGFGFNKQIVRELLQDSLGYQGIVCSDWGLLTPVTILGHTIFEARDFGVENLSAMEKVKKALEAGLDQFGGESVPELIVALVARGEIPEARVDHSVRKLLRLKFQLGLFDNPFVEEGQVAKICGDSSHAALGFTSQVRAQVLLKNALWQGRPLLPLAMGTKIFVQGFDLAVAQKYGNIVSNLQDADVALVRVHAPFEPKDGFIEKYFHQGRVHFTREELQPLLAVMQAKPTVANIYLERGIVLPEIHAAATALTANFGASDEAIFAVLFGKFSPTGKLPFELPRSAAAVAEQKEDLPHDSAAPLFPYGFGLSYTK